jgi:hypothetical protein
MYLFISSVEVVMLVTEKVCAVDPGRLVDLDVDVVLVHAGFRRLDPITARGR